jgi:hypothetical protein
LGTIAADGGIYDVYKHPVTSADTTIIQFFSIRRTSRHCGHISISEHFSKWADLGMELGKLHEIDILVEAGGGTGSIDFTTVSAVAN